MLSDGLFSTADLRLMELELLCVLEWNLNPPTTHLFVRLLMALFDAPRASETSHASPRRLRAVSESALRYADEVRLHVQFNEYPSSMIAVAAVICSLKRVGVHMDVVSRWMRRVKWFLCGVFLILVKKERGGVTRTHADFSSSSFRVGKEVQKETRRGGRAQL